MGPQPVTPRAQIAACFYAAGLVWLFVTVFGVAVAEVVHGSAVRYAVTVMVAAVTIGAAVVGVKAFGIGVFPEPDGMRIRNLVRTFVIAWDSVTAIGVYTAPGIRSGTYQGPAIEYRDTDGHLQELRLWHLAGHLLAARPERMVERLNRMVDQARERRLRGGGLIAADVVDPND